MNRKKLTKLGIERDLIDELLHNKHYTPVDATALVEALTQLKGVQNLDLMVDRAGSVDSRDVAIFVRRRIELTAAYQTTTRRLARFERFGESPFPLIITKDRGVAGIYPIDILSWTENTSDAIDTITRASEAAGFTGPKELRLTGTTTQLANARLKALGWIVGENIKN